MGVPVSQMWTVASYVIGQKLRGREQYPVVLMLAPLLRCNLACAGCGKIQYPAHILKTDLTPEQCFAAVEECGTPMVSIPGGEPLMHPQIAEIVEGLVARKKYIYLCTNALLLKEKLHLFTPSKYLTFSVHMDGQKEHHDFSVCREGGYEQAIEGIREAIKRGFRVTTNTTLFDGADPKSVRGFFDEMMELGVEGMMLSPGYSYEKAPDQKHFLGRARTRRLFRAILSNRKKSYSFRAAGGPFIQPIDQTEDQIQAWAADARLDYLFPDLRRTRLSAEVILASGDDDRGNTSNTFNGNKPGTNDRAFNAFGLLNTGLAFAPAVSNLLAFRVGGSTFPLPEMGP